MDLQRQTALIVGGTGDIGHATAKLFVEAGARVIITGRQRERAAAKAQLLDPSARGHAVSPDDEAELRRFFGEIGAFDHLVLTLGTQSITLPFAQLNDEHLRDAMDSKYMAYTRTLRAALGYVQQSVTWLTGAAARTALPGLSNYAAPNGALHAMMGPLAMELAPIRINCVAAGLTHTAFWKNLGMSEVEQAAMFSESKRHIPIGHIAQPEEIAEALFFAATNTYTTGTVLDTCGGLQMGQVPGRPDQATFGGRQG